MLIVDMSRGETLTSLAKILIVTGSPQILQASSSIRVGALKQFSKVYTPACAHWPESLQTVHIMVSVVMGSGT